jgi:hypothetical protein
MTLATVCAHCDDTLTEWEATALAADVGEALCSRCVRSSDWRSQISDRKRREIDRQERRANSLLPSLTDDPRPHPATSSRPRPEVTSGRTRAQKSVESEAEAQKTDSLAVDLDELVFGDLSEVEMRPIVYADKPLLQASAFHLLVGRKGVGKAHGSPASPRG